MPLRSKRTYRRKALRSKRRNVRRKANRKVATVALVKKLIHKNMENKLAGFSLTRAFPPAVTSTSCYGLLPTISTGTTDNARIGNRINPRGLLINLVVHPSDDATIPAGTTFMPRIMIVSQRSTSGYQPSVVPDVGRLLDFGGGEHSFAGTLNDYTCPINTDSYTVHKDIKTMVCVGNGDANPNQARVFKFWIPCPKTLVYDDAQQYPQNFAPQLILGWANALDYPFIDIYVTATWTSTLYYEDA